MLWIVILVIFISPFEQDRVVGDSSEEYGRSIRRKALIRYPRVIYPWSHKRTWHRPWPMPKTTVPSSLTTTRQPVEPCSKTQKKSWTFGITYYQQPYAYLKRGKMVGFTVDLIQNVCRIAGETCHTSYLPESSCSITVNGIWFPGSGLTRGDFDVCVWWPITVERENSVDFTSPYRTEKLASWLVKMGNPYYFDPQNLIGKTIVTIEGWYPTPICLQSVGRKGGNFIIARNQTDAINIVASGKADALFSQLTSAEGLEVLTDVVNCTTGNGMMLKKGSPIKLWWNNAFASFVNCGCFQSLCQTAKTTHGLTPSCTSFTPGFCSTEERRKICGN